MYPGHMFHPAARPQTTAGGKARGGTGTARRRAKKQVPTAGVTRIYLAGMATGGAPRKRKAYISGRTVPLVYVTAPQHRGREFPVTQIEAHYPERLPGSPGILEGKIGPLTGKIAMLRLGTLATPSR